MNYELERKTIREILPNVSDVIQAVIDGIKNKVKDKQFVFDMSNYGYISREKQICVGCLATATICNIYDIKFEDANILGFTNINGCHVAEIVCVDYDTLSIFESAINQIRYGSLLKLFYYYDNYLDDEIQLRIGELNEIIKWSDYGFECIDNESFRKNNKIIVKQLKNLKEAMLKYNL